MRYAPIREPRYTKISTWGAFFWYLTTPRPFHLLSKLCDVLPSVSPAKRKCIPGERTLKQQNDGVFRCFPAFQRTFFRRLFSTYDNRLLNGCTSGIWSGFDWFSRAPFWWIPRGCIKSDPMLDGKNPWSPRVVPHWAAQPQGRSVPHRVLLGDAWSPSEQHQAPAGEGFVHGQVAWRGNYHGDWWGFSMGIIWIIGSRME